MDTSYLRKKRIKLFLSIWLTAISATQVFAQEFIPKAGVSFSSVSVSDEFAYPGYKFSLKPGFVVGLATAFEITERWDFQGELLFIQKGWNDELDLNGLHTNDKFTLNYLEIPMHMRFTMSPFYAYGGGYLAFGLNGNYSSEGNPVTAVSGKIKFGDWPTTGSGTDYYINNRFDAGFQLGGGIKIKKLAFLDVRYSHGLINFMDKGRVDDNKTKNFSWVITTGVVLERKKKEKDRNPGQ